MKFDNTPPDGGSYEKPKPGKYIGMLIGFAFVGTHSGGQYGPKPKVMLRWELHKRKGPVLDSQGHIHTIVAQYGATIRGDNSLLRKCLEAHGIDLPEGQSSESRDWLGHCAWLDLEESDDKKYVNVVGVSKLDPDDDPVPTKQLHFENWEPDSGKAPPSWCAWMVARSTDIAHLAPAKTAVGKGNGRPAAAPAAVAAADDDDSDIPF